VDIPLWSRLCVGIGLATPLAYFATPLAIGAARRFALYDLPAGDKGHATPTPYLGGLAVMVAFALALLIVAGDPSRTLPVLGGVGILLVLGTADDLRTVAPGVRVAVEFGLGAWLSAEGLGWRVGSAGWVGAAVTGIWVVAVVNAFNLFDNMDGAASSMASVVAAGACVLALVTGDAWVAAGSAALCGACLGFLPHNMSSPAKVFLGDGGSLPLGFAVAALVAAAARSAEPSSLALLVGLLLVGIPALDTTLVIVSRLRRGVSILTGGQDHLTHRTRRRWGTSRRVALVLGGAQGIVSAVVIVASREGSGTVVAVTLAFVVVAVAQVVILEAASTSAPEGPVVAGRARPAAANGGSWPRLIPAACLGAIGLGSGLSPLFSAYYNPDIWVPIGLVLVIVGAVAAIGRPPRFALPVTLSLTGLSGLGLWSLLSTGWAHAVEQATVDGNLWISYAALFGVLVSLMRRPRHAGWLLAAIGTGIVAVALTVLVRMLGGHPGTLFIAGRLNSPLGYINGEGCLFAMGGWLTLALAERRGPAPAGVGMAGTVGLMCLALMSQSRGAAIATFVALLVVLVAVPGWRRRVFAVSVVAAGVAAAFGPILDVYRAGQTGALPLSVAHHAAAAIVVTSVAAGVVWAMLVGLARRADGGSDAPRRALRRAGTVLATGLIAAPLLGAVVAHSTIQRDVRMQWHEFTHLAGPTGPSLSNATVQTRLLSGAGNRYDYWRVAWHVFTAHPIAGVGAGNYPAYYFRQRATTEAIQNPHSIELQTLSELGLVGAILLAMTLGGAAIGAGRLRVTARISEEARTTMVAATGVAVVWTVDTSGDWMHLLPGVSAIALCAFAVLCRAGGTEPATEPATGRRDRAHGPVGGRVPALAGAAAVTFVMAVGGASLLRSELSQHYLNEARSALATRPSAAIDDAQRVLDLDGENLDAYYVKAAGQARFDRAADARFTLLQATRQDPGDFVTWTLLGDLEARAGDLRTARAYYRRALQLDPREPSLRALVADPAPGTRADSG
jgi:UDP-GlcNAc:undecaprenyl-phosphate/decaprenyl-phosphate GlcNAc-1-phosphate transferase